MSRPAILVVGGAGYIGAHTCKALHHAGYAPVVFDNLSTGHAGFVKWGPLVKGDIRNAEACAAAIRAHKAVAVVHFAASALVGESMIDPEKYYDNNVVGTLSLLRGMRMAGCTAIVFSSSCATYGAPDLMPIEEDTRQNPVNPYGASKLAAERILADYDHAYGLRSVCLRFFNACGADLEGELGELRDPETHLIPRAMMAIQGHIEDFAVFGSDFPTPDGTAIRDYVHVADLASAHLRAVRLLLNGYAGGAFNLGAGRGYSVKQVLDAIAVDTGEKLPVVAGARRPGDPAVLVADASRAGRELDFAPAFSDLATIVRTAWAWHRVHIRAGGCGKSLCLAGRRCAELHAVAKTSL
jgi:UDP-arabinose 4-epimerase